PALRRLPQRVPGVPADRRARVRPHVSRADRDPAHPPAQRHRGGQGAGPRLPPLPGGQGRLSAAPRHPPEADRAAPAPPRGEGGAAKGARRLSRVPPPRDVARRVRALGADRPAPAAAVREGRAPPATAALPRPVDGRARSATGGRPDVPRAMEGSPVMATRAQFLARIKAEGAKSSGAVTASCSAPPARTLPARPA